MNIRFNPTTKIVLKWVVHLPQNGTIGFDPQPSRLDQGFVIKHYAGCVEYNTKGWLDKSLGMGVD